MSLPARSLTGLTLSLVMIVGGAGCALTSKSEPITPRYFTPERTAARGAPMSKPASMSPGSAASTAPSATAELRLGRITSTAYLDERMVYRDSPEEVGYYLERRWTEAPEHYFRRGLSRVLFEQRGLQEVVGGASVTLDVELTAFEEIRGNAPIAHAQAIARLRDQRVVVWEETLTSDKPIAPERRDDPSAAVDALSLALAALIDQTADRAMTQLASIRVPPNGTEIAQTGHQGPPPPPPPRPRRAPDLQ